MTTSEEGEPSPGSVLFLFVLFIYVCIVIPFIIAEGDILDMRTSKLWRAFLDGEELDLKNEQVKLAEKYLQKYQKK